MAAESRLLQQETGVIQLLMERADALGMVSDSLWQRTSLMGSCCFPSDEELEKSEVEDVRTGKKKKRSGSFQGEGSIRAGVNSAPIPCKSFLFNSHFSFSIPFFKYQPSLQSPASLSSTSLSTRIEHVLSVNIEPRSSVTSASNVLLHPVQFAQKIFHYMGTWVYRRRRLSKLKMTKTLISSTRSQLILGSLIQIFK